MRHAEKTAQAAALGDPETVAEAKEVAAAQGDLEAVGGSSLCRGDGTSSSTGRPGGSS